MEKIITITVNGFSEQVPENKNISQIIELLEEGCPELIVELNNRFVHFRDYDSIIIKSQDNLELIHAAFGG